MRKKREDEKARKTPNDEIDESINKETKKVLENKVFFFSEAFFCKLDDSMLSMNTIAPQLIQVKDATEMEAIFKQTSIPYWSIGRDATFLNHVAEHFYKRQCGIDDPTSLYAKWLFNISQTAKACLDLYRVCLRVERRESEKTAIANIMDMLYYADKAFQQMYDEVYAKKGLVCGLSAPYELDFDYCDIPNFPLISVFRNLQKHHEKDLHKKYDITHNATSEGMTYQSRYWDNAKAANELQDLLWQYATKEIIPLFPYAKSSDIRPFWPEGSITVAELLQFYATHGDPKAKQALLDLKDSELARKFLALLDIHMERRMSCKMCVKIDSVSRKTKVVSWHIDTALFLWIYTQIQRTEDYCICRMCGEIFQMGSQKSKRYCDLHKKSTIDYFNSKLRKKEKELKNQEKGAHFEVAWNRNAPEITFAGDSVEEDTKKVAECG